MKKSELIEENARLREALEKINRYATLEALPEFPREGLANVILTVTTTLKNTECFILMLMVSLWKIQTGQM